MQTSGPSIWRELELLEYRRERIELLLSDRIVSPEMESQLRQTLALVDQEIESLKANRFTPAYRQAA